MSKKKYGWALTLAQDLKVWCLDHKMKPSELGQKLRVDPRTWRDLTSGRTIVQKYNGEVYALIYHKLNLPSSDPRTIPVRINRLPSGQTVEIQRAWSEDEWQRWLVKQQKQASIPTSVSLPPESLDARIRQIVKEAIQEALGSSSDQDIGKLAQELLRLLNEQGDTPAARDEIAKQYGPVMAKLLPILDAFTQSHDRREEALGLTEVFHGT